jgi:hypothetical protein
MILGTLGFCRPARAIVQADEANATRVQAFSGFIASALVSKPASLVLLLSALAGVGIAARRKAAPALPGRSGSAGGCYRSPN